MTLEEHFQKALGELQFHLIGKTYQIAELEKEIAVLKAKIAELEKGT